MRQAYKQKRFTAETMQMVSTVNSILDDYRSQGYDLSLRQLYYQLVSRNIVTNDEKSYGRVGAIVSEARLAGLVDWDMIKDRGRNVVVNPHWRGTGHFLESCAPQFRHDLWQGQENYVEVMVEKQALEGVLEPVCSDLDVAFTANKGYSSSSAMREAGIRMMAEAAEGKRVYVIYLGDHDPSGIDMGRDVLDRLRMFGESESLEVNRVALNMDQVEELRPPENPAKTTDSRASSYIARFGESSWELDAIEPRQLAVTVREAVRGLMDMRMFSARKRQQDEVRAELVKLAKKYSKKK